MSQLSIRGNYRDVAAHDMAKSYSRNIAHRQLFVSDFAQSASRKNTNLESIKAGPPVYLDHRQVSEMSSFDIEFHGLKPADLAMEVLAKMEKAGVSKKTKWSYRYLSRRGELLSQVNKTTQSNTPSLSPMKKEVKKFLLRRGGEIGRLNYRFFYNKRFGRRGPFTPFPNWKCRKDECNDPVCNHGVFKAVSKIATKF